MHVILKVLNIPNQSVEIEQMTLPTDEVLRVSYIHVHMVTFNYIHQGTSFRQSLNTAAIDEDSLHT